MWRKTKLLIWGTTYPEFSAKYYETVCTGAVDAETGKLVRIYPITLRYQKNPFHHYSWIEAEIERNVADFRPESHKIRQDNYKVLESVDTKHRWSERSKWVLAASNVFESVEALVEAEATEHTSLGLVKVRAVDRIYVQRKPDTEREEWEERKRRAAEQRDFFVDVDDANKELVYMPVRYKIAFRCHGSACKGHDMSVVDWGMYVLSRKQYRERGADQAARDVIGKLREYTDVTKKDAYLFLGNTKAHSQNFMAVGLYYPPLAEPEKQPGLPGIT